MNRDAILFHLREAKEELDRTISEIAGDSSYEVGQFRVAMSHLYHHINTAWNGRDSSPEQHQICARSDFDAWRKFPPDEELFLN